MKRSWWLVIGLTLGLAAGLTYAWLIEPVQYVDNYPPQMASQYRRDWIRMTAFAHGYQETPQRTEARLMNLAAAEIRQELSAALDIAVAQGQPSPILQRMAALARQHNVESPSVRIYTGAGAEVALPTADLATSIAPEVSATPSPTLLPATPPLPTATPLPPLTSTYVISSVVRTCLSQPRIALSLTQQTTTTVRGEERRVTEGIPNVETWLLWSGGADRAITGLRPQQGSGYVDFTVEPDQQYNLYLEQPTGAPLTVLDIRPCETQEGMGWTGWLLTLRSRIPSPGQVITPSRTSSE